MDSERQPLLPQQRCRSVSRGGSRGGAPRGALSCEEVRAAARSPAWRRARAAAALLLWALVSACLALATWLLVAPHCATLGPTPAVPPVFVSYAPLMASVRDQHQKQYFP